MNPKHHIYLACLVMCLCANAQTTTTLHDPAEYLSHTLPVLYINTEDSVPVTSKDYYLTGSYYLDAEGFDQYESIGSAQAPLPLQIKGRGNASWALRKKPYRIKLDKKASLLGMPKSKHWCLMAAMSDWRGKGRDYMAFEIARRMGMPWTPGNVPCELVLNGDYVGLYFVVEKIRIAKDRVNIVDQEDEAADTTDVTGGWLLEIDNYKESNQVRLTDVDGSELKITHHSPEIVTAEQQSYITQLLTQTHQAITCQDKGSREWEKYIDMDALARFYVIQEVVDNQEAFSGSCWFYKDQGDSTKFIFGPVWDFGSSMGARISSEAQYFMYENTVAYVHNHWIKEVVKFPRFQIALRKYWKKYRDEVYPGMSQFAADYASMILEAGKADYKRWGDGSSLYLDQYLRIYIKCLDNKRLFLSGKWNEDYVYPLGDVNLDGITDVTDINIIINILLGRNSVDEYYGNPDIDNNGLIDISDVNLCINCILSK